MQYPQSIKLKYPTHLSPFVFNKLKNSKCVGLIENENFVTIEGQSFHSDTPLSIGANFVLSAGSYNALLYYQSDLDAYEKFCEEKRMAEIKRQEDNQKLVIQRYKEVSDVFWSKYKLPFKFSLDVKEVLSGLGANSFGNGQKSNSVYHIYLHENIEFGKFKRKSGDFLCSQVKAKYGSDWSGTRGNNDNEFYVDNVKRVPTCKKCLEILERWAVS